MKPILSSLVATLLAGTLIFPTLASASTPDGQTPANEGVCDDLKGGTPGLYGLCVAFCEAQDHAAISAPITPEEAEALANGAPSGRILANYNKKKQEGDPDMPCIKVEETCPCWSSEEFDAATLSMIGTYYCNVADGSNGVAGSSLQDFFGLQNIVVARKDTRPGRESTTCSLGISDVDPMYNEPPYNVQLPFEPRNFNILDDEFAACDAQIRARQDELQMTVPPLLGACFPSL